MKYVKRFIHVLGVSRVMILFSMVSQVAVAEPLYLVKNGMAEAVIVQEQRNDSQARFLSTATGDLRKYIKEITGADIAVVPEDKAGTGPVIHVGSTAFVKSLHLGLDKLDMEGVAIKRFGNNIVLAGGSPLGTLHATRMFIEDVCGVRWCIPGDLWRLVPKAHDVKVDQLDCVQNPDYLNRYTSGVVYERWMEWNRANWPERYWIGHNIGNIIDPEIYGEQHPEYFPLIGGKRVVPRIDKQKKQGKNSNWQPCLSNPDLVKIAVNAARKFFDENPDAGCFSLAQNDNFGWCQCNNCIKMNGGLKYDNAGHICFSDLYFHFVNSVCRELEKTHPHRKIGVMAYQSGTYLPPSFKAHPNVIILIVNDRSRFHFDAKFREEEKAYVESWAMVASAFCFHNWHYGSRYLVPRLELRSTQDFLRYGHSIGAISYHGEEYPNWGLEGPKTWITVKLLWNVDADVNALLRDFCDKYFEDAAEPVLKFYNTLEDAWNDQPILNVPFNSLYLWREDRRQLDIVSPDVVERCRGCLNQALKLTNDDTVRRRIEQIQKTFRVTEYYSRREAIYKGIDPEKHLTPTSFVELVSDLNQMQHVTNAIALHVARNIRDDQLTFHKAQPGVIPMDIYYCELGSQIARLLALRVVARQKPASQAVLTKALLARFDELSKTVIKTAQTDSLKPGLAWQPFAERVLSYLYATAFVPRFNTAAKIDGHVERNEWQDAPELTNFKIFWKKETRNENAKHQTVVRVGYDDNALYVVYVMDEQDVRTLVQTHDGRDSAVWQDDAVDFTILPAGDEKENFYHYIINPARALYDARGAGPGSAEWSGNPTIAIGMDVNNNTWTIETAIPWSDFGNKPQSGDVWRAQFARINVDGLESESSCWASTSSGFNNADYLGVLLFE